MHRITHSDRLSRRRLLAGAAACAGSAAIGGLHAEQPQAATAETLAGRLHASLTPAQREQVCFPWDYRHPKFGLLRTRVGANWNATEPTVAGDFFTKDQQRLVREIFEQLIEPDWHARFSASRAAGRSSSCSPAAT
jgi:hypothetical protein